MTIPALWQVVLDEGLEGMLAKRLSGLYRPGQRDWIKVKPRLLALLIRAGRPAGA